VWDKVLGFTKITDPAPFERMPLTWANAFGGWDRSPEDPGLHEYDARNPVGKGFRAKKSSLPTAGEPLPNLEDPANPMKKPKDRPPPAGFGPIGPHWLPRSGFTGTYDEAWVRERMPQLPDDFDARFYDRAPPELVLESAPPPGTLLTATGVSPSGPLRVELPDLRTEVQVVFLRRSKEVPLHVDTILLDAGKRQLVVAGSGLLPVEGELGDVVNIVVRPQRGGRR
jgi:hypothetical protein